MISFNVEVILDGYWDRRPPDKIKAGILADWADALQDWTQDQVLWGLRKWRNENPSKKPNPGHIMGLLKVQRGVTEAKRAMAEKPEQETTKGDRVTAERAAQIIAEAGYAKGMTK